MDRLTLMPFLLALVAGLAAMPTNVYQICAWNIGTAQTDPWRSRAGSSLLSSVRTSFAWLAGLWRSRACRLAGAVALALLAAHVNADAAPETTLATFAMLGTLDVATMDARGKDIIALASGTTDLEMVQAEYRHFSETITRWAEDRLRDAKADGRNTLHADDSRKQLQLRAIIGDVQSAVANRIAMDAQMKANRARVSGAGGVVDPSKDDWKSIIPSMSEYKSQSIGSDPAGGYLVTADVGPFFDRLRPESVVLSAGPRVELCNSDALEIPFLSASTTAENSGEFGELTESSVTIAKGRIPMRKYAAFSTGSSEWFADAAHGPRQIIEMDHRNQIGALIDRNMLQGNGSTITGLRQAGTATALAAAGAAPTLDNVLDGLYRMEANSAKPSAIFMHPRTWNTIRKIQDLQDRYQLAPDPSQSAVRQLFGLPVFLSSQISITETSTDTANTDCSYIVIADMRYAVVGRRQEVQVLFDPFTYSKTDKIAIRSTARFGFDVILDAAVEVLTGVRA